MGRDGPQQDKKKEAKPTYEQLEASLKSSKTAFQTLLDISPFSIAITRLEDESFMLVNQHQCEVTGYTQEQIIGRTPKELNMLVDQGDRNRMIKLLQKQGYLDKFETRFKTKNDRFIHSQVSARLIKYEEQDCLISASSYVNTLSKTQQALQESEKRFRNILNSIPEGYYEVDLKGRFVFFNDAILNLFGCSSDELMKITYKDYTTPEDAQKILKAFNDVYSKKHSVDFVEYGLVLEDGTVFQVEVSISLLRDNDGNIIGFYGINRDRTEQKKSEDALRESEEKYRTILEEMDEGYYESDLHGNLTFFNDATLKIHRGLANDLLGKNYKQYLSPVQAQKNFQLFKQIYETGENVKIFDYEIIREDGSICLAEISGYPRKDQQGKITGFWGITRDRTEQKKAEIALKKSEELYRQLVENANDGIYITHQGHIKFHNSKTVMITGYNDETLENMKFSDLIHPEDKRNIYDVQQSRFEQGVTPEVFSFRVFNKEKAILWVELSMIDIIWEGETAVLNFLRDVTHQKKIEGQLVQAQKMEAIGTLAGGIAHDFNNILASMIGFTELVLEDVEQDTSLADNLKEVLIGGGRAKDLVNQILAFARQSEENLEPVMVCDIANEALRLIRSSLPSTIEIQSNIISESSILANPTQVNQIIMNLCTNAAHAMEESGGTLSIDLFDVCITESDESIDLNLGPGDYLKLEISDTGAGIPPDTINSIFEPYFTTKKVGEGTGMGLSVVQGIVQKYGGRIRVQSEPSFGTMFTLYFPVVDEQKGHSFVEKREFVGCGERILLVDDEFPIVKMGRQLLMRMGYEVTTQTNSQNALELFRSQPDAFDLVITDMTMPNLTGDQLAQEMLQIRPDILVVLCTGYSKQITEEWAEQVGIKALVFKPIVKDDLAATIRRVLDKSL